MEDEVVLLSSNINSNNTSSYSYTKIIKHRNALSSFSAIDHRKSTSCNGGTNKRCSRLITKHKQAPKIRIIHIIPPEIIQTDKANFRNLVQSLTGRTSSSTAKKLHRPQVSSSCQNKSCFSRNIIRLDRNAERSSDDHLFSEFDHEVSFTGGFQRNDFWDKLRIMTKIEEDEMVVEATVGAKWELKDKTECGFCSEGFLQEIDYSPLISPLGSNWEIDLFGEI